MLSLAAGCLRLSEDNLCLLHRERLARFEAETPQLALLYSLLHRDFDPKLECTQAMVKWLAERGMDRGFWKTLLASDLLRVL